MKFTLHLVLLQFTFSSVSALAATTVVNFQVTLGPEVAPGYGLVAGSSFSGAVAYDNSVVPMSGTTSITKAEDSTITLSFDFAGFTYQETDDTEYPLFPRFRFVDGNLAGIAYVALNKSVSGEPDAIVEFTYDTSRFYYSFDDEDPFEGTVTWPTAGVVPEPRTLALCAMSSLLFVRNRKR
ncbi:hypothetical protein [Luteolibacter sp. AS25]|uniref:hypothetical protein n=1 Tax=Luteolibacter sp. AS25 TaxID=3135776 RepID=UPI00398AE7C2